MPLNGVDLLGLLGQKSDVSGHGSGVCHEGGWVCATGEYGSTTYIVNGMVVSARAGQGLLSMGAAANCPQCRSGDIVGADGKIYRNQWIDGFPLTTGSVTNTNCSDSGGVCSGDVLIQKFRGHYDWLLAGSVVATGDVPVGMDIWHCAECKSIWQNTGQLAKPGTYARFYGASAAAGMVLVPSAGFEAYTAGKSAWLTFEYYFPGATADIINILSPGPNVAETLPGAIVWGYQYATGVYDWYEGNPPD